MWASNHNPPFTPSYHPLNQSYSPLVLSYDLPYHITDKTETAAKELLRPSSHCQHLHTPFPSVVTDKLFVILLCARLSFLSPILTSWILPSPQRHLSAGDLLFCKETLLTLLLPRRLPYFFATLHSKTTFKKLSIFSVSNSYASILSETHFNQSFIPTTSPKLSFSKSPSISTLLKSTANSYFSP